MLSFQHYVLAESLEQAYELNQKPRNRIIGGGLWMRLGKHSYDTVIDLGALGLHTIQENKNSFLLGAMVSLRQLETHEGFRAYTNNSITDALQDIVGVQFRNCATLGGSIFGRFGFSDVLTAFLVMDCQVELFHGGRISLEQFCAQKPDRDILTNLIVRKTPGAFAYQAMRNANTDFPILTCAAAFVGGEYRLAIGARPTKAVLLRDTKGILTHGITPRSAKAFATYAAKNIPTGGNTRGSAAYRTQLLKVLTERTLLDLREQMIIHNIQTGGMTDGN